MKNIIAISTISRLMRDGFDLLPGNKAKLK
jgi:hypothetical protein